MLVRRSDSLVEDLLNHLLDRRIRTLDNQLCDLAANATEKLACLTDPRQMDLLELRQVARTRRLVEPTGTTVRPREAAGTEVAIPNPHEGVNGVEEHRDCARALGEPPRTHSSRH